MASKVLGDDFAGTSDLAASAVLLATGIAAPAWEALVGTTATSSLFARSGLGATLVFPPSSTTTARRLRLTPSGLSLALGAGVTTIEAEAYGGLDIWLLLDSGTLIRLGYDGFGSTSSTARYFVDGPASADTPFAATLSYATPTVWRIEIDAAAIRFYRGGALVQSIAASVSPSDIISRIDLNYFAVTDLNPPFSTTSLTLKYLHIKTETVSGALGAPAGAVLGAMGAVSVSPTTFGFTASWATVANATGYEYSLNGAAYIDLGAALTTTVQDLPPGSTPAFAVRAYDATAARNTAATPAVALATTALPRLGVVGGVLGSGYADVGVAVQIPAISDVNLTGTIRYGFLFAPPEWSGQGSSSFGVTEAEGVLLALGSAAFSTVAGTVLGFTRDAGFAYCFGATTATIVVPETTASAVFDADAAKWPTTNAFRPGRDVTGYSIFGFVHIRAPGLPDRVYVAGAAGYTAAWPATPDKILVGVPHTTTLQFLGGVTLVSANSELTASWPEATNGNGAVKYEYSLDGSTFTDAGTERSISLPAPTAPKRITVRARDRSGVRSDALSSRYIPNPPLRKHPDLPVGPGNEPLSAYSVYWGLAGGAYEQP